MCGFDVIYPCGCRFDIFYSYDEAFDEHRGWVESDGEDYEMCEKHKKAVLEFYLKEKDSYGKTIRLD